MTQLSFLAATPFWQGGIANLLGVWVAVGFCLALYTFLYKDNPVFKFAEHVYIGVTNGYLLWQAWLQYIKPQLVFPLGRLFGHAFSPGAVALDKDDTWWLLIPAALSLFMLLRFHPRSAWLSRWSFAFMVGSTAGVLIPLETQGKIFRQLEEMLKNPAVFADGALSWWGTASNLLILAGVVSVLVYFIFSVEHKGPVRVTARIGIVFLMIAFGAHFGYTVMGRESLLIGQVQFLLEPSSRYGFAKASASWHLTLILLALIGCLVALFELRAERKAKEAPPAEKPPVA